MIKGKTESGFEFEVSTERLNNYELLEAIGEMEDNELLMPKVVNLVLGKEQAKKLKDHLRTPDGMIPVNEMTKEITEIFQSQTETKNS